jgi:hypothetical protein
MLWEEYRQLMEYGSIRCVVLFQIANKILSNGIMSPVQLIALSSL